MTSAQTLECRIYLTEDEMYRLGAELDRHLHDLESRLQHLTAEVHRVLCESGRIPLDEKVTTIIGSIGSFVADAARADLRSEADVITGLKDRVDSYMREIALASTDAAALEPSGSRRAVLVGAQ